MSKDGCKAQPGAPPEGGPALEHDRLVRIESKLTQLMHFLGMDTDGRKPIQETRSKQLTYRGKK